MNSGDIVRKTKHYAVGSTLLRNVDTIEQATAFMLNEFKNYYACSATPQWEYVSDNMNAGKFMVVNAEPFITIEDCNVNWVVGDEMSISPMNDMNVGTIVNVNGEWKLHVENNIPKFKEEVSQLSDDELRKRIEEMRGIRAVVTPPKPRAVKQPAVELPPQSKLDIIMAGLTPEQQTALKAKLGLV